MENKSNVKFSKKLKIALSKINDEISRKLIDMENKLIEIPINYFDVNMSKNDTVTFTPFRKYKEILEDKTELVSFINIGDGGWLTHNMDKNGEIFSKLGYVPNGDSPYKPNSEDIGEVIRKVISETSGKTFVYVKFKDGSGVYNNSRLKSIDDRENKIWYTNRQEIKIGRVSRLLLNILDPSTKIHESEIETFVNSFKSTIDIMNDKFSNFDIVSGSDIGYWYNKDNYYKMTGSLSNSCQSIGRLDWLDIYIKNPDTVSLIILRSEEDPDKIMGRSLLWTLEDGCKFQDTIYVANDSDNILFKEYAKENNWLIRENISYWMKDECLRTNIKNIKYRSWPSIDTMRYRNIENGDLCSYKLDGFEEIIWNPDEPLYDDTFENK